MPGTPPPEPPPGWVPPSRPTGNWRRVGVLSALVWVVVGLAAAYVSAQLGAPRLSGWLAILAGPVAFVIIGRAGGLTSRDTWARAGCVGLAAAAAMFSFGVVAYTLVLYG